MATTGKNSRGGISKTSKNSSSAKKSNQNYSTSLASGGSVKVVNGVKTYSDKPQQVTGNNGISISGKSYSKDKGGTGFDPNASVINAETLKTTPQVTLPPKPQVTDLTAFTDSANSSLATGSNGAYTYDKTTGFVNTPQPEAKPDTATSTFNQMMAALGGAQGEISGMNERFVKEQQNALRPKEKAVQSYQNQLNQITSQRDQQQLGLEGQGRGQTSGFLGGEQARIGREAAIAAMPIQAQLAAAQDDLESARSYVSQLYTAKAADAQAKYQYEAQKIQSIYSFLTAEEAKVARAKELAQSRAYQVEDRNLTLASNLAQTAMEFGQSSLAGKIMALDEKSPTFQTDLAALQGQVRKPVAASAAKAPTLQNFGTSDAPMWKQYNYGTGKWDDVDGNASSVVTEQRNKTIADELATKITNIGNLKIHKGLNSAVGAVGLGRVGLTDTFGAKDEFIGKVEQLVSREFLDTLISTKAKGATFGALTKPEQDALTNAATAIGQWRMTDKETGKTTGYDIDETSFKNELGTLVSLAQKAESRARGYDVTVVPSYDSQLIDSLTKNYQANILTSDVSNFYK